MMLYSYSCAICLTLVRGFGIGPMLFVVETGLSSVIILSLCFTICLMLGLGVWEFVFFGNLSK